jgi:hypothetical protein
MQYTRSGKIEIAPARIGGTTMKTAMNLLLGTLLFLSARAAIAPSIRMDHGGNGGRPAAQRFANLPLAAQASISAALGRDLASYQIRSQDGGLQSGNARHQLAAEFTATGVAVRHGGKRLRLALQGYGYAGDLTSVRDAVPTASANRVEYHRGPLTEWYVNGPAGLEQGFTLAAPPSRLNGQLTTEPLQIALSLSGDFAVTVDQGQGGLTLTARDQRIAMRYAGLNATDAAGKELPAWLELRGKQLLLEVASNTVRYPLTIDPVFQVAKLAASDGAANDILGGSVSVSGKTIVAGAGFATIGSNSKQGAVYVFVKPVSGWANMTQTAKLTASDGAAGDALAEVSISGNTIVAGAAFATIGSNSKQGAVYVFVKPVSGWANMTQTAKLTASDGAASDRLGLSVSVSHDTVIAGSNGTVDSNVGQGAAYVFVRPADGWANMTQTAKLTASDGAAQDSLGTSVSLSGRIVVAGAPNATIGSKQFQGAAYVFVEPMAGWVNSTQTAKLTSSDGRSGDAFGISASSSGNTVAVGAFGAQGASGTAYVFVKPAGGWANMTQTAILMASVRTSVAELGSSISINGDIVVAGAPGQQIRFNEDQGAAYVFVKPAGGWVNMTQSKKLRASDGAAGDLLGNSVSVSGNTTVAGAPSAMIGSNSEQGAAYVFIP